MTAILPASRIGLGCSRLGATLGGASGAAAEALLRHALASGIRLLDTADIYGQGDSERLIGAALREWGEGTPLRGHGTGTPLRGRGEGVLLVTKAGQRFTPAQRLARLAKTPLRRLAARLAALRGAIARGRAAPLPRDFSPAHLARSIAGSLGRLGVARIDRFLLHSPDAATLARLLAQGEAFALLDAAVRDGRLGGWGVSCDDAAAARAALAIPQLAALQLPLDVALSLRPALEAAAARGVVVMLREVLAGATDAAARRSALRQALGVRGAMVLVGTTSVAHLDEALGHAAGAEVPA